MKILYGVPGEGMGHATRSKVIITYLVAQGHEVQVVSSSRAFQFLTQAFPGWVHEIKGYHLAYSNAAVSVLRTAALTLRTAPENLQVNFHRYRTLLEQFSPDLIISDFESFTYLFAKYHRLPVISIDNMQIINRCAFDITIPATERNNYAIAKNIVKGKVPNSQHYLIATFFKVPLHKERTTLVPPIIRAEILAAKTARHDHILVYQTSTSQKNLVTLLQQLPQEKFLVYGFNKEEQHGNVQLKAFSEMEFIRNLATAKAVLANGGFSLLSEAVYLHKPICSVPIANQFEQFLNGAQVQKLGYGRHFPELSPDALKAFIYDIPVFQENISQYQQDGNKVLFAELDKQLAAVSE